VQLHEEAADADPVGVGAAALRVVATLSGTADSAAADMVVDVRDARWSVLFFDPRPSWQSTFVRRAIERDPRFVVTSRVVTSRNVSVDAGEPPSRLDDRHRGEDGPLSCIAAELSFDFGDVVGEVAAARPTPLSVLRELVADNCGFATAVLDVQSRLLKTTPSAQNPR